MTPSEAAKDLAVKCAAEMASAGALSTDDRSLLARQVVEKWMLRLLADAPHAAERPKEQDDPSVFERIFGKARR